MQDLFVAKNKQAQRIEQAVSSGMEEPVSMSRTRSLSPSKAGRVYGKFTPSPLKTVKVQMSHGVVDYPMTRKERRLLARRLRNGR
jgi:hypothetical protein